MAKRQVGAALLAFVLAACSQGRSEPQACTLIGCENGLEVTVRNAPADAFRVDASSPEQSVPRVHQCRPASGCTGTVFFRDFTPESVTLRVITATDTVTRAVTPDYRTVQPNGAGCPPTCRQARVVIDILP